jgi:hypothetical protein
MFPPDYDLRNLRAGVRAVQSRIRSLISTHIACGNGPTIEEAQKNAIENARSTARAMGFNNPTLVPTNDIQTKWDASFHTCTVSWCFYVPEIGEAMLKVQAQGLNGEKKPEAK